MFHSLMRLRGSSAAVRWGVLAAVLTVRLATVWWTGGGFVSFALGMLVVIFSAALLSRRTALLVVVAACLMAPVEDPTLVRWAIAVLVRALFFMGAFYVLAEALDRADFREAVADRLNGRVAVVSRDGRYVYMSRSLAQSHHCSPEDFGGRHFSTFHPEWLTPVIREMLEGICQGKSGLKTPILLLNRGGEMVPLVMTAEPLLCRGETYAMFVTEDVAGPGLTQQLFSAAFDATDWSVVLRSPDGSIIWCNQRFAEAAGTSAAELVGQKATPFRNPAMSLPEAMENLAAGSPLHWDRTLDDGRCFEAHAYPVLNADGTLLASFSLIHDVTERKQAESRATQAERLAIVGQLAAGMAHNFNNVLAAIAANAELLQLDSMEARERIAENILVAVEHGSATVQNLYELAGCNEEPRLQRLAVPDVVGSVLQLVDAQVRQVGVVVSTALPEGLSAMADPSQLKQVLINLVLNSLQAMPSGGRLELAAGYREDGMVELRVTDTGCGISPENLTRIFTPFFTTKKVLNGTGLGLSTSLAMVRTMGGTLTVESAPGAGTTVRVCLPAA